MHEKEKNQENESDCSERKFGYIEEDKKEILKINFE